MLRFQRVQSFWTNPFPKSNTTNYYYISILPKRVRDNDPVVAATLIRGLDGEPTCWKLMGTLWKLCTTGPSVFVLLLWFWGGGGYQNFKYEILRRI